MPRRSGRPDEAAAARAMPSARPTPAEILARATELIAAHPRLPMISSVNGLFELSPPHVDLWVDEPEHVRAWANALHTRVEATTTLEDHPRPSHTITRTPRTTIDGVSYQSSICATSPTRAADRLSGSVAERPRRLLTGP